MGEKGERTWRHLGTALRTIASKGKADLGKLSAAFRMLSCITSVLADTDYNNDRKADIAFYRPGSNWNLVPAVFSSGNGDWNSTNYSVPDWANQPGVVAVLGDYDGDGRTDIAFYRPGGTCNTVPVLFSNGDGTWRSTNSPAPDRANQPGVRAVQRNYSFGSPAAPSLWFNPGKYHSGVRKQPECHS